MKRTKIPYMANTTVLAVCSQPKTKGHRVMRRFHGLMRMLVGDRTFFSVTPAVRNAAGLAPVFSASSTGDSLVLEQ